MTDPTAEPNTPRMSLLAMFDDMCRLANSLFCVERSEMSRRRTPEKDQKDKKEQKDHRSEFRDIFKQNKIPTIAKSNTREDSSGHSKGSTHSGRESGPGLASNAKRRHMFSPNNTHKSDDSHDSSAKGSERISFRFGSNHRSDEEMPETEDNDNEEKTDLFGAALLAAMITTGNQKTDENNDTSDEYCSEIVDQLRHTTNKLVDELRESRKESNEKTKNSTKEIVDGIKELQSGLTQVLVEKLPQILKK